MDDIEIIRNEFFDEPDGPAAVAAGDQNLADTLDELRAADEYLYVALTTDGEGKVNGVVGGSMRGGHVPLAVAALLNTITNTLPEAK